MGAVVLRMLNYLGPHPLFRFVDVWKSILEVQIVLQRRGSEQGIDSTRPAVGGMEQGSSGALGHIFDLVLGLTVLMICFETTKRQGLLCLLK